MKKNNYESLLYSNLKKLYRDDLGLKDYEYRIGIGKRIKRVRGKRRAEELNGLLGFA